MHPGIAAEVLKGLWQRDMGRRIANLGISMSEGKDGSFEKLRSIIEKHTDGFMPTDFGEDVTKDITKLLELASDNNKFQFNIPSLSKRVYGIGRGDFALIHARPETGKSALCTSLAAGPGGFAEQGLHTLFLGNEEAMEKTMLRCYSAWSGMTKEEITAAPHLARERFELIEEKITLKNIMDWPLSEIEAYIKYKEADVVFVDQFDKIDMQDSYDAPHLRLRELYTQGREIPKRQNCALFGVSQSSAEAEGKTVVTPSMMEGSKTGKFAEADLILGVGKYADNEDGTEDPIRFITVGKNKLSGWHGTLTCKLETKISRYSD